MNRQPLLIMLLCFILGIVSQEFWRIDTIVIILLLCFSFVFIGLSFSKVSWLLIHRNYFFGVLFFGLGQLGHQFNFHEKPSISFGDKSSEIVFKLDKKLNSNSKNRRYQIEVLYLRSGSLNRFSSFMSILSIPKDQPEIDFKNYYQAKAYVNEVIVPEHDFVFDYNKYLQRQNVFYQTYLPAGFLAVKNNELTVSETIKQKRLDVLWRINESSLVSKHKEFLKGIILADRTDMDEVTVKDFNQSGLTHLLAISGSHMVIIFWIILFVLKPFFSSSLRKIPIIIALVLIWFFAIFIDYGSSVVRSCIMISVYYILVLLQRKTSLLHSVALSALIILILDSNQIFDVGFQLSYFAVLGIYWLNPIMIKIFRKPKFFLEKLTYNIFSISLSAQLATIPIVLYYFHQFSLVSILANLVVLPFSEIIIVFSLLMVVVFSFSFDFKLLSFIYDQFVNVLLELIHFFAKQDFLLFKNVSFSFIEVVISLICIYYFGVLFRTFNLKRALVFMFMLLLFNIVRQTVNFNEYNKNEILHIQNFRDKILIIKENDEVVFVVRDSSNLNAIKKSIINPYLSYRRLDDYKLLVAPINTKEIVYKKRVYNVFEDINK